MVYNNGLFPTQTGKALITDKHPSSDEVKQILDDLNSQWEDLASKAEDKGNKLRQAAQQQMLNRALDDAQVCPLCFQIVTL